MSPRASSRVLAGAIGVAAVAFALAGCGGDSGDSANKLDRIKAIVPSDSTAWLLPYVAQREGQFRRAGLDVEVIQAQNGPLGLQAVTSGNAELGFNVLNLTMQAASQGQPVVNVGSVFPQWDGQLVVASDVVRQRGIDPSAPLKDRMRALKGLTFSDTGPGSGSDRLLRYLLKQGGLDPDRDVHIIPIKENPATEQALETGRIQGFIRSTPGPQFAELKGAGKAIAGFNARDTPGLPGVLEGVVFAEKDYASAHRDLIRRFMQALAAAAKYARSHGDAVMSDLHAQFKGLPEDVYARSFHDSLAVADVESISQDAFDTNRAFVTPPGAGDKLTFGEVVANVPAA